MDDHNANLDDWIPRALSVFNGDVMPGEIRLVSIVHKPGSSSVAVTNFASGIAYAFVHVSPAKGDLISVAVFSRSRNIVAPIGFKFASDPPWFEIGEGVFRGPCALFAKTSDGTESKVMFKTCGPVRNFLGRLFGIPGRLGK